MAVYTFWPNPHPETTSCDGRVFRNNPGGTWADIRDGAGNTASDNATAANMVFISSSATTNRWNAIVRSHFGFDTSAIDDSETIDSAVMSLWLLALEDAFTESAVLCASTPASATGLVAGDYANFGTMRYSSDVAISALSINQYNDWTLNSAGLAAISKTGVTSLGLRLAGDIDNAEPSWLSNTNSRINGNYAENASGTARAPKLVVTTSAGGGSPQSGELAAAVTTWQAQGLGPVALGPVGTELAAAVAQQQAQGVGQSAGALQAPLATTEVQAQAQPLGMTGTLAAPLATAELRTQTQSLTVTSGPLSAELQVAVLEWLAITVELGVEVPELISINSHNRRCRVDPVVRNCTVYQPIRRCRVDNVVRICRVDG